MKTRESNLIRLCFVLGIAVCATLVAFPGSKSLSQEALPDVSGTVDCKEVGRLNGEVGYQYEVTLTNNTESKLIVKYNVIFMAGDVPIKNHNHSTLMIPNETLTETHDGKISEAEWDRVSSFRVEWESEKQ